MPTGGEHIGQRVYTGGGAALLPVMLNLAVPGAGVVWLGSVLNGVLLGGSFALLCNWWVWAIWIVPGEFAAAAQMLLGLAVLLLYTAAQLSLARTLREWRARRATALRRAALTTAVRRLEERDVAGAWTALLPVLGRADRDLLIAYRAAQVLTVAGDVERARRAWRRVRALDPHGLYRRQIEQAEAELANSAEGFPGPTTPIRERV